MSNFNKKNLLQLIVDIAPGRGTAEDLLEEARTATKNETTLTARVIEDWLNSSLTS